MAEAQKEHGTGGHLTEDRKHEVSRENHRVIAACKRRAHR